MPTLTVEKISKSYDSPGGTLQVLCDVDLSIDCGQAAVIMGPSGCGKSTLLNILGSLEQPTGGRITLDNVDPTTLDEKGLAAFRNRSIGFVFQDHHLLPHLTVLENTMLPALVGSSGEVDESRARELLAKVGLADRLEHLPAEISGGERQRAAIARALMNRPKLVLADEPTGNLDRVSADRVADMLQSLHREQNVVLILVTHSEPFARRFDKRYELLEGRLKAC